MSGGASGGNYKRGFDNFVHNAMLFDSKKINDFKFSGTKTEDMHSWSMIKNKFFFSISHLGIRCQKIGKTNLNQDNGVTYTKLQYKEKFYPVMQNPSGYKLRFNGKNCVIISKRNNLFSKVVSYNIKKI